MFKKGLLPMVAATLLLLTSCGAKPVEGMDGTESSSPPNASTQTALSAEQTSQEVPSYYSAYAQIVAEYEDRYGPSSIQQTSFAYDQITSLMGVCIVRLIDFDRDGTEELLLIWAESEEQLHSYAYGIWTSPDGKTAAQLCENQIFSGTQSYQPYIELVNREDGVYLGEELDDPDFDGTHVYRKVSAGGLSDVLRLSYPPAFFDEALPVVNGETVSYEALDQAREEFLAGAEVTRIDLTSWSVLEGFTDNIFNGNGTTADEELHYFQKFTDESQDIVAVLSGEPIEYHTFQWQSGDTYSDYAEVLSVHLAEYGEPVIRPTSSYSKDNGMPGLGGLCVVRLVDLNRDGTDELLLAGLQPSPYNSGDMFRYKYSVWTMKNSQAMEIKEGLIPESYEPSIALLHGADETYFSRSYDTNTDEAVSIADVELDTTYSRYDGRILATMEYEDLSTDVWSSPETEWIYFTAWSYRWAAGMDWDTDSQQVLSKTQETINLIWLSSENG